MSQRVYLLTVRKDLVGLISEAVGAETEQDFAAAVAKLRDRSEQQLRASDAGKRRATLLDEAAFARVGRIDDFYLYTSLRPYFVTEDRLDTACAAVSSARHATDVESLERLFDMQLSRVSGLKREIDGDEREALDDPWNAPIEDLRRLGGMRRAALSGIPYVIHVPKTAPFGDVGEVILDEKEAKVLQGRELAETYGFLLGATLGRVAGLTEPSWWMGRNFWLGLMIAEEFGIKDRILHRRLSTLNESMTRLASSPGHLFDRIGVEGYEDGFPLMCEGYSSGLIFGGDAVSEMRRLILASRPEWIELGVRASGHEQSAVAQLYDVVLEAFTWADEEGCALMEGDELVGAFGFR